MCAKALAAPGTEPSNPLGAPERRPCYHYANRPHPVGWQQGVMSCALTLQTVFFSTADEYYEKSNYGFGLPTRDRTSCKSCIAKAHGHSGGSPCQFHKSTIIFYEWRRGTGATVTVRSISSALGATTTIDTDKRGFARFGGRDTDFED
ncbi:unnamed protein product [Heligmosomoides polygyrus]|uniref:Gnk2-homologous domain-containing protein n=1 Tax=Heligmosomoides polygyrus TaxID=6339 RepID=A0A183GJ30_HELPZ|nr:unnamed protein product [Heligmosomoides polygyrus]